MKYICAVYDRAAECFGNPFFVSATGLAIRDFTIEVNRDAKENLLSQHPLDFELYCLGEFDEAIGEFTNSRRKLVDAVAVHNVPSDK